MRVKAISILLACAVVLSGCGTHQQTNKKATAVASKTKISSSDAKKAPTFTLKMLNGQGSINLNQYLGSKWILLNAWASWCPPCQQEAPEVEKLYRENSSVIEVIGVNMTADDGNLAAVRSFVNKYHLTFPVVLDSKGAFAEVYHVMALPTTFLISPKGNIVATHTGGITKTWLQGQLSKYDVTVH